MSRRHRQTISGSLDLLLDTITNTLGGVLLLALLLVLLVRAAPRGEPQRIAETPDAHDVLEETLAARQQLASLVAEQRRLASVVSSLGSDSGEATPIANAVRRVAEMESLRQEIERLGQETAMLLSEAAAADQRIEYLSADAKDAERDLADLRERVEQARLAKTDDLPLSREGRTRLTPAPMVIRYGKIYFQRQESPADARVPNTEDFFDLGIEASGGSQRRVISPKPWRGIPILQDGSVSAKARQAIGGWPAERYYIVSGVWDDSFAEVRLLRRFLVQQGYRYRWIPVTVGDAIYEGGGANVTVQ